MLNRNKKPRKSKKQLLAEAKDIEERDQKRQSHLKIVLERLKEARETLCKQKRGGLTQLADVEK